MNNYHDVGTSENASAHSSKAEVSDDAPNHIKLERRTVTKLDLLLVPSMSILYLLAFLDRTNVGNARVAGLQSDLAISDHQYQTGKSATIVKMEAKH